MKSILEQELERAIERLKVAEEVLAMAYSNYQKAPTRENRIALKAATRLMKESSAEASEWTS